MHTFSAPWGGGALVVALLVATSGAADTELGPVRVSGEVEIGGRSTWVDGDRSVFDRYRDLEDGAIGYFDLLFENQDTTWFLHGSGWNVGYDDQRYELDVGRYGWFRFGGFYGELPVVVSNDARTLYGRSGGDTFRLPAGLQASIEGAADQSAALAAALSSAESVDLDYRWLQGGGDGEWQLTPELGLHARYELIDKKGSRPFSIQFGSPGGTFTTFASSVDEKIHEARAGLTWSQESFALSLDYIGSFFEQDLDSLTADNPLVAVDALGAGSRGRTSVMPDNQANQFVFTGSGVVPLGFRNRLSGTFSYQRRTQDERFLPNTINSAITTLSPSESNLDGHVDTFLGNLYWTLRPIDGLTLKARYRIYDFDNKSDGVLAPEHVVNDTTPNITPFRGVRSDYRRQNASLFGVVDFPSMLTWHLGFAWEGFDRSENREVEDLDEYGPTLKLDWRLAGYGLVQADYSYRRRTGSDYGTFNGLIARVGPEEAELESFIADSKLLRKFLQADRNSHDLKILGRFNPAETVELGLNGGLRLDDYDDSFLGLTQAYTWSAGADGGWQPHPRVGLALWYTYEQSDWEQSQRWRPRSFINPPTFNVVDDSQNDWFSETEDQFHNVGVRIDLELVPGRLSGELGYLFHYGKSDTSANGAPGFAPAPPPTTSGDGGDAVDWPTIDSMLNVFTAGLALRLNEQITLRGQYRFEDYQLDDFTQPDSTFLAQSNVNGSGAVSPSLDVWLGEGVGDYRAHVLALTASITF